MAGEPCPRRRLIVRISVPAAIKTEAWVWRRAWKVTDGSPNALTARPQSRESLSGEMAARSPAIGSRPRARWAFATRNGLFRQPWLSKKRQVVVFAAPWPSNARLPLGPGGCRQRDYRRDLRGREAQRGADKTPDFPGKASREACA